MRARRRRNVGRAEKAGLSVLVAMAGVSLGVNGLVPAIAQAQPASGPEGAVQIAGPARAATGSLAGALAPNGALAATSGSYSTRGYRMMLAANGAPRFVPNTPASTATAKAQWSENFGGVGASNSVLSIAVSGANVYIGMGITTSFGGVNYNHVAHWDGKGWRTMSSGLNGYVNGLAALGADVYAVGTFTTLGDGVTAASHVAMWDGTRWSALGSGITTSSGSATLNSVAAAGSVTSPQVYVGGEFDTAGGNPALNVAEWNGTQWTGLGAGLTNYIVNALATDGTTLYAGGSFTGSGTTKFDSLARWDGTTWSQVGGAGVATGFGYNGKVTSLALSAGNLYVSGSFGMVGGTFGAGGLVTGGVSATNVAEWNGSSWAALAGGLPNGAAALGVRNGILYAGGGFGNQGNMSTIQSWNGTAWGPVGKGLACCGVNAIGISTSGVIAGGSFIGDYTGATLLNNIGQWNGKKWIGYGLGTNSTVSALSGSGTTLYAAGGFTAAGSLVVNNIARLSGSTWSSMGSGITAGSGGSCGVSDIPGICALTVDPATGYLYVGGSFTAINNVPANDVAVWNGKVWKAVGGGTNGVVNALAIMDGVLYAGGSFTQAEGNAADDLAEWPLTGGPWSALPGDPAITVGSGNPYQDDVDSLTPISTVFSDHYLAIGGGFLDFTGTPVGGLVLYDATTATPSSYAYFPQDSGTNPGVGVSGAVLSMLVDGTDLYLGGSFIVAGGHSASNIAVVHMAGSAGALWGIPGQVTGSQVSALTLVGSTLYLGGAFTAAGGVAAANVASYTPGAANPWSKLATGIGTSSDVVNALWQGSAGLYAGGRFSFAGGRPSTNIGLWSGTAGL